MVVALVALVALVIALIMRLWKGRNRENNLSEETEMDSREGGAPLMQNGRRDRNVLERREESRGRTLEGSEEYRRGSQTLLKRSAGNGAHSRPSADDFEKGVSQKLSPRTNGRREVTHPDGTVLSSSSSELCSPNPSAHHRSMDPHAILKHRASPCMMTSCGIMTHKVH